MRKFLHDAFNPFWLAFGTALAFVLVTVEHLGVAWFFSFIGIYFGARALYAAFRAIHESTAPKDRVK